MFVRSLAALALSIFSFQPAFAAGTNLHVGAAYVSKIGSGPHAVILMPGLGGGSWAYDGIAPELAKRYTVYRVTFAGFDGEPPVQGPYLDAFAASIIDLIAVEKLRNPILIGHSLGGHLALRIAAAIPDAIGGVVAIDALPLFPAMRAGDTMSERQTYMGQYRDGVIAAPQAAYEAQSRIQIATLVTDPKNVDLVAASWNKADRGTIAGAIYEMSLADLHTVLSKIAAPLLLIGVADTEANLERNRAYYASEYAGTPHLEIAMIAPSKHYVMYDQAEKFAAAMLPFLAKVTR
jgi:pimeloyl-ACP methyl ester carboxylesterase